MSAYYGLIIELSNFQEMKNWRSTESFCLSILTIYKNDWSTFWHVYCCHVYFFSVRFLNRWKLSATFYLRQMTGWPTWIGISGNGSACFPSGLGMMNAGCLGSMRSESFLQTKFIIFQGCPTKQAAFLLEQPAQYNQLLIQSLLFVSECYFA